jgi:2-polyprenyl-6-methoxyphenol hydroxylase-like FAD-dependent oxidoreductase
MKIPNPFITHPANVPARHGHALVIGGSIAGLLAAWVLADHVEQVTIIERDHLPTTPTFRPGVPQAHHYHFLLVRGRQLLEMLFPGLGADLIAAGALLMDWSADLERFGPPGQAQRFSSDLHSYACSRDLLEWSVRRRVAQHPRIHFREGCRVVDLVFDQNSSRITGVWLAPRSTPVADRTEATSLSADLVVDASGRTARTPQWLAAHGYPTPTETVVDSSTGYATRYYELDPSSQRDWQGLVIYTRTYGASLLPLEGGRWSVLLTGMGEHAPPTDEAGFMEFIRNLSRPDLYTALEHARPLSPIYGYRRTENRWRHYERLDRRPENFLVLGDAVCALNPIYGQGMTTAALGAITLDRCLRRSGWGKHPVERTGLAARFQRQLARTLHTSWLLATSADTATVRNAGDGRRSTRLIHAYMDQLYLVTRRNRRVALARYRVAHLVSPPISLLHPGVALPVIANWVRTRLAQRQRPDGQAESGMEPPRYTSCQSQELRGP